MKIYHNPRCSKSRQALAILTEGGAEVDIVAYLQAGLDEAELVDLQAKLGLELRAMMRTGEAVYKELGLKEEVDEAKLRAAIIANPIFWNARWSYPTKQRSSVGRPNWPLNFCKWTIFRLIFRYVSSSTITWR